MTLTAPTAILLDTTPLGLLTQKLGVANGDACKVWYGTLVQAGCRFFVPEIADYELRREFLRQKNVTAVLRLDAFITAEQGRYLPLTTPAIRIAAELWAQARQQGNVTAQPAALDGDALIAAQANLFVPITWGLIGMVVATANVSHLSVLTTAETWEQIRVTL